MAHTNARTTTLSAGQAVEMQPGIVRTTMSYTDEVMLCHFALLKGAVIALHQHAAAQTGFVMQGSVRLFSADGGHCVVEAGGGYAFGPNEPHGAEALEDTCLIECFSPMRSEYL